MDDYIDVKIDVFEHTGQRARLRRSLTVHALIEEILREFDDITADSPEKYAIYLKGFDHPLKPIGTLAELDIQPQDELVFDYVRQTIRRMLDVQNYAILREESTGKEFDIQWQPAVIGRPSTDVDHNIILAVNVQLLPDGKTISRRHAQITFAEGRYFIEPLAEQNPSLPLPSRPKTPGRAPAATYMKLGRAFSPNWSGGSQRPSRQTRLSRFGHSTS